MWEEGSLSSVGVFVPVSVVFPGTRTDRVTFVRLLSTLSRGDVMFWCARLNHIVTNASGRSYMDRQVLSVQQLLPIDEARLIDHFAQGHGGEVTVFFRGSLLEVLRWAVLVCDDHSTDGATFEDPEVRRTFAKVALIASDIWGRRVYGGALSLDQALMQRGNAPSAHSERESREHWWHPNSPTAWVAVGRCFGSCFHQSTPHFAVGLPQPLV